MTVVVQGNVLSIPLADASVDLIITSPPYFALRSYRDGDEHYQGQIGSEPTPTDFLDALIEATKEMIRVLKPSGSIWVNLGDKYQQAPNREGPMKMAREKAGEFNGRARRPEFQMVKPKSLLGLPWRYAIRCIDELGLILRAEVVWSKPNGLPESVTDRVRRSHEQWFHMTKEPRYFTAIDEIREPHAEVSLRRAMPHRANVLAHEDRHEVDMTQACHPLGKLPGSVWTIPSEPLLIPEWAKTKYNLPDHFAAFPQEWPRRIILGFSPSGICVECGEGRRPVVSKDHDPQGRTTNGPKSIARRHEAGGANGAGREVRMVEQATITGYACACPEPIAETRPAVCLDPFGGTGTVAMVARALGRTGVSLDLSMDYCKLARWRIFESGHAKKTIKRTNQERQGTLI